MALISSRTFYVKGNQHRDSAKFTAQKTLVQRVIRFLKNASSDKFALDKYDTLQV
jgi:hypothetical protein